MEQFNQNPWLGLKAYEEGSTLYGRDEDTINLSQMVFHHKDTVLYGRSGIGKSSLINANLLPMARRYGMQPLAIRLDHHDGAFPYVEQIRQAIEKAGIPTDKPVVEPHSSIPVFWELFHCYRFVREDKNVPLLIIFDQFEEIFTQQQNQEKRLSFFKEIADFINDIMPRAIMKSEEIKPNSATNTVSLDFDELGLSNFDFETPEEYTKKFVDDNEIHILFSLREDFLSEFEYYTSAIPSLKQHRYGLRPVTVKEAEEIIVIPGKNCLPVDEGERNKLVEKIIDFSREGDLRQISTLLLSLTCYLLYQKTLKRGSERMSLQDFEQIGANLVLEFYDSLRLGKRTKLVLESRLIDSNGRRNTINKDEIEKLLPNWEELTKGDKRILQVNSNNRIELVHDLLALAIYKTRKHRQKKSKDRILKLYLLFLVVAIFFMGLLGSVFTIKENDKSQRIPIKPEKIIKCTRGEICEIENNNYVENITYEGGDEINIKDCPQLKRIHILGSCDNIKLENCPQLRYIELEDSICIGDINIKLCPNLKQLYLPQKSANVSSDNDLVISPNPKNTTLIFKNGILWNIKDKSIEYIISSKIISSCGGEIYEDFPMQMKKHKVDSIEYKEIYVHDIGKNSEIIDTKTGLICKGNNIIGYTQGDKTTYDISNKRVSDRAFENCDQLEEIILNDKTYFRGGSDSYAGPFIGCSNLRSVVLHKDMSFSNIVHLIQALGTVTQPLTYEVKGDGLLQKGKDGVITYNGNPVLISDESSKSFAIKRNKDTIYVCSRGWLSCYIQDSVPHYMSWGIPNIEDLQLLRDSINYINALPKTNFASIFNNVYIGDDFTNGELKYTYYNRYGYVYCKGLSVKKRLWQIDSSAIRFRLLADSVKKEITLVVPYGKLEDFLYNNEFLGFKDIKEASLWLTVYNNAHKTFDGANAFFQGYPVVLFIFLTTIICVVLLCSFLSIKRIKLSANPSYAICRGIAETVAMVAIAVVVWAAFYWLIWYWGPDTVPYISKIIICNVAGIVAAVLALLLMYKNALYLLKTLRIKTVNNLIIDCFFKHKKPIVCLLIITALCLIVAVVFNNYKKRIAIANHLLETVSIDIESGKTLRKKAALYAMTDYLKKNKPPTSSIADSIYTLCDTLAREMRYDIRCLDKLSQATCLALSPDETKLAVACRDSIYIYVNNCRKKGIDINYYIRNCKWMNDSILILSSNYNMFYCNINNSTVTFNQESIRNYHLVINGQNAYYTPCSPYYNDPAYISIRLIDDGLFIMKKDSIAMHNATINDIGIYKSNIITCSNDSTLKMYEPQSGEISLLYKADRNIKHLSIGYNDSIIAFSTYRSLCLMKQHLGKWIVKRYRLSDIEDVLMAKTTSNIYIQYSSHAQMIHINPATLELGESHNVTINPDVMEINADGMFAYFINKDDDIYLYESKTPSKEELLEIILHNFELDDYKPTEGELLKYQLHY